MGWLFLWLKYPIFRKGKFGSNPALSRNCNWERFEDTIVFASRKWEGSKSDDHKPGNLAHPDFFEAVRSVLIDKDRSPRYAYRTLADVSPEPVERFFQASDSVAPS